MALRWFGIAAGQGRIRAADVGQPSLVSSDRWGFPRAAIPSNLGFIDRLSIRLSQRVSDLKVAIRLACSARTVGYAENAIYSGHFDGKCHFMWPNHANSGAHLSRKLLIFIGW